MSYPPAIGDRFGGLPHVIVDSNRKDDRLEEGSVLPPLFTTEDPSSIKLLIDSNDRNYGTHANFRVSLNRNVPRCRFLQVQKVILPKIPNINPLNNEVRIVHNGIAYGPYYLQSGFYNTTAMCNALVVALNSLLGGLDTFTVTFDPLSRRYNALSLGAINWYFTTTCSFISRGRSCCGFQGYSADPLLVLHTSGIAGMMYTRYLAISSSALTEYSFSSSILSSPNQNSDIIAVCDLSSVFNADDFDVSKPYTNQYVTVSTEGPMLCVANSQRSLVSEVDIQVTDEFSQSVDSSLSYSGSTNTLGIVLIMKVTF